MDLIPCPTCGAFSPSDALECPECHAPLPADGAVADVPSIPMAAAPEAETAPEGAAVEPRPDEPPAPPPFETTPEVLARIDGLEAQIASRPHAPAMYLQLAKIYRDGNRQDLAVATLERCLAVDPTNVYVRHRLTQLTGMPDSARTDRTAGAGTGTITAPAQGPAAGTAATPTPSTGARPGAPTIRVAMATRPARAATPTLLRRMTARRKAIIGGGVGLAVLAIAVNTWVFPSTRPLVVGDFHASSPVWSPTGRHLAFLLNDGRSTRLGVYDFGKGDYRTLAPVSAWDATGFSWSPDGARIAYTAPASDDYEAVSVVDVATGQSRPIAAGSAPAWSPDGRTLLMTCAPARPTFGGEDSDLSGADWNPRYCTADVATGEVRRSAAVAEPGTSVSPAAQKALSERYTETAETAAAPTSSGDGELQDMAQAVAARGARNLAEGSRDLSRELTARRYAERRKAARNLDRLPYGADIVITDIWGGSSTAVTSDGRSAFPSWSPDGSRVLFATDGSTGIEIWSMNADGGDRRLVLGNGLRAADPSSVTLSMDGKWVFFVSPVKGDPGLAKLMTGESPADLFVARVGGKTAERLENRHPFKQRFGVSPDGRRVAYEVLTSVSLLGGAQRSEIWLMRR